MKLGTILWRSCRLRCVRCGRGRLFRGWFRMHPQCENCGLQFERGQGYYLGSIYFNYGLTALVTTAGYLGGFFWSAVSPDVLLWSAVAFCVLFPIWFFRYARSLWLGMDYYFDPPEDLNRQDAKDAKT